MNRQALSVHIVLLHLSLILECKGLEDSMNTSTENSPVEVIAVFINCELEDEKYNPDSEVSRFEREELFKHNALRDCSKKLALTIKMTSEPSNSGDEYVPIDHVLEGPGRRRVRLLEPYVLRLRRDWPRQAYKLRLLDVNLATRFYPYLTVKGILSVSDEYKYGQYLEIDKGKKRVWPSKAGARSLKGATGRARHYDTPQPAAMRTLDAGQIAAHCDTSVRDCDRVPERVKRQEHKHNLVIETPQEDFHKSRVENTPANDNKQHSNEKRKFPEGSILRSSMDDTFYNSMLRNKVNDKGQPNKLRTYFNNYAYDGIVTESESTVEDRIKKPHNNASGDINNIQPETRAYPSQDFEPVDALEKEFALYEIGSPDIWVDVHIQMFQKISTDKGNTLWNDFTKGEVVRVSTLSPDWSGRDMAVQYRPAEIVSQDEFTLPMNDLCLLVPLPVVGGNTIPSNIHPSSDDESYIVVPLQDVKHVDVPRNASNENTKERRKRVIVRVERAWNVMEDSPSIVTHGSESYLTMLHRSPHHAQIELEVRADENELVRVGAQIRECKSGLIKLVGNGGQLVAGPLLLAPRHVGRFVLEMPIELPPEPQHCTVSLINSNEESIAVRDLEIRKGDRCFCVWHCDCICYGENPKLPCEEMSEQRLAAAGLPARRGARLSRAACYADSAMLNGMVIIVGVILTLLIFGLLKGFVGLCVPVVGVWGLHRLLRPRPLARYYEAPLRTQSVQYDECGWPVHPQTLTRTVQVVSKPIEFVVNTVFFVVIPGLVVWDLVRRVTRFATSGAPAASVGGGVTTDAQSGPMRFGRRGLREWMTPHAEDLSANVWRNDPTLHMFQPDVRPLLGAGARAGSGSSSDSEQDDTAFVLMHMRNSTDSLARSQKKPDSSSSAKHQLKYQKPTGTCQLD